MLITLYNRSAAKLSSRYGRINFRPNTGGGEADRDVEIRKHLSKTDCL